MIHAQGAHLYKSRRTGLTVHASACGKTDSLHAPLTQRARLVSCAACMRTSIIRNAMQREVQA